MITASIEIATESAAVTYTLETDIASWSPDVADDICTRALNLALKHQEGFLSLDATDPYLDEGDDQ